MRQSEKVALIKKERICAAKVICMFARFNYRKRHLDKFPQTEIIKVIKLLKFNLKKLHIVKKEKDMIQNKLTFEEELNRQLIFLKDQFSSMKEKVSVLSELQNLLYEDNGLSQNNIDQSFNSPKNENSERTFDIEKNLGQIQKLIDDPNYLDSIGSFQEEIKINTSQKKKTPYFNVFMREKRMSDYKLTTVQLRSPTNKLKETNLEKKNTKAFINSRKSFIASQKN